MQSRKVQVFGTGTIERHRGIATSEQTLGSARARVGVHRATRFPRRLRAGGRGGGWR